MLIFKVSKVHKYLWYLWIAIWSIVFLICVDVDVAPVIKSGADTFAIIKKMYRLIPFFIGTLLYPALFFKSIEWLLTKLDEFEMYYEPKESFSYSSNKKVFKYVWYIWGVLILVFMIWYLHTPGAFISLTKLLHIWNGIAAVVVLMTPAFIVPLIIFFSFAWFLKGERQEFSRLVNNDSVVIESSLTRYYRYFRAILKYSWYGWGFFCLLALCYSIGIDPKMDIRTALGIKNAILGAISLGMFVIIPLCGFHALEFFGKMILQKK